MPRLLERVARRSSGRPRKALGTLRPQAHTALDGRQPMGLGEPYHMVKSEGVAVGPGRWPASSAGGHREDHARQGKTRAGAADLRALTALTALTLSRAGVLQTIDPPVDAPAHPATSAGWATLEALAGDRAALGGVLRSAGGAAGEAGRTALVARVTTALALPAAAVLLTQRRVLGMAPDEVSLSLRPARGSVDVRFAGQRLTALPGDGEARRAGAARVAHPGDLTAVFASELEWGLTPLVARLEARGAAHAAPLWRAASRAVVDAFVRLPERVDPAAACAAARRVAAGLGWSGVADCAD